jgi:hypothetical protein
MALSAAKNLDKGERIPLTIELPVATSTTIYQGALVCKNASGYAVPGSTATTLTAMGWAEATVTNSGSNGAVTIKVKPGVGWVANSASADAIATTEIGSWVYIVDDATVAKTDGTASRSPAGKCVGVETGRGVGVLVDPFTLDFPPAE